MKIKELILQSEEIIKRLSEGINKGGINLKYVEEEILRYVNKIGDLMVDEVVERVEEPVYENRVVVEGEEALFDGERNLRFINRFGKETVRRRRCYKYINKRGGYYPLDEKIGMEKCGGFSPLMTYLQALFASSEPYERSEELLSGSIGFKVSATAIQRNTEIITGNLIDDDPYKMIAEEKRLSECDLMVVEMDGTMSPQIHEEVGITGREGLKQPTEYKECNILVIDKYKGGKQIDHWLGARYGKRKIFEEHMRKTGLKMGQMIAKDIVYIADGAKNNWDIKKTNFPRGVEILDFYHASEHLGNYCLLFKDEGKGENNYKKWRWMMLEGEILQIIAEMKERLKELTNGDRGQKEINYFMNNKDRMDYKEYKDKGYPIGSGAVEGSCKYVVGKRFKGSGMRWKKDDNERVLKVRLAKLNGILQDYFVPQPKCWSIAA